MQELQVVLRAIMPCLKVMKPDPWHVGHFWGVVPGLAFEPLQVPQISFLEYSSVYVGREVTLVVPLTASLNCRSTLMLMGW